MKALVQPFRACGEILPPSSKSELHRILIAAALADRETEVVCHAISDDVLATMRCLSAFGAGFKKTPYGLLVLPLRTAQQATVPELDCGESGSTLRFLVPLAALLGGARLTGHGRLPDRPILELMEAMRANGAAFSSEKLPFVVSGQLGRGIYRLPGHISSQYITGLMLALPLVGDSEILIEGALQSIDYVRMTADVLHCFGVTLSFDQRRIVFSDRQRYQSPGKLSAQGDWSAAAFPLCLGALSGAVTARGVSANAIQGDRRIASILRETGAKVSPSEGSCTVKAQTLRGIEVDVSDIPDLAPVLAALLMHAEGTSILTHAERLRLKESDRLMTTCAMVNSLGGSARIEADQLIIVGKSHCPGGTVDGAGDHRIVMAAAVAASKCQGPSQINGAEAVRKSWPGFFDDIRAIGGKIDVIDDVR